MMKRTRIPSFQKFIVETVLTYITKDDNYTGYIVKIRENPDYINPQQPPNYKKNNAKSTKRQKRNISHRPVMR